MSTSEDATKAGFRWLDPDQVDADAVLRRLLSEAAREIPGLSPDPSLTDPLARLLLAAVGREYSRLYGKLDDVIDEAHRKLVSSLLSFPRAPRPSSTVLQLEVKDCGTPVDENLQVVGRKALGGAHGTEERGIHFSPGEGSRVSGVPSPVVLLEDADGGIALLHEGGGKPGEPAKGGARWSVPDPGAPAVHLGFDLPPSFDEEQVELFLLGGERAVAGLVWSVWHAGPVQAFVPGHAQGLAPWHGPQRPALFRSRTDRGRPESAFDRCYVRLDRSFLQAGEGLSPPAAESGVGAGHLPSVPSRRWIRVALEDPGMLDELRGMRMLTNCVVAFNLNHESVDFKLGAEPVQRIELPVAFHQLFRIDQVHDNANNTTFEDAETAEGLHAEHRYHLDTHHDGRAVLRLGSPRAAGRPRRLEVQFATTYGDQADGLDPGSIDVIYDRRLSPGVSGAVNVSSSAGGEPAGRPLRFADELRAVLATRGRAVTASDYVALARAFDPHRVEHVEVGRGVTRTRLGLATCVDVRVRPSARAFTGRLEREAFLGSLHDYLQARAPAGRAVVIHLVEEAGA